MQMLVQLYTSARDQDAIRCPSGSLDDSFFGFIKIRG